MPITICLAHVASGQSCSLSAKPFSSPGIALLHPMFFQTPEGQQSISKLGPNANGKPHHLLGINHLEDPGHHHLHLEDSWPWMGSLSQGQQLQPDSFA